MTLVLTCITLLACAFYLDWAATCVGDMLRRSDMPVVARALWALIITGSALLLLACIVIYPFIMVEWTTIRGVSPGAIVAIIGVGVVATAIYVAWQRDQIFVRRAQRRRSKGRGIPLKGFWILAAILTYWKLVGDPDSISAPPPFTWWNSLQLQYDDGSLMPALKETVITFGVGLIAATIVGVIMGNALGASARLERALGPTLEFMRNSPPAPYVPILLLFFPVGRTFSVVIIVLGAMWPILLNTAAARIAVPPLRLDVARSFNLARWARQQKIILPSLIPGIAVGLRIAGPVCLILTILVDLLTTAGGLGSVMTTYQQSFDAAGAFAVLMVIGIIGYLVAVLIVRIETFLLRRWPETAF